MRAHQKINNRGRREIMLLLPDVGIMMPLRDIDVVARTHKLMLPLILDGRHGLANLKPGNQLKMEKYCHY